MAATPLVFRLLILGYYRQPAEHRIGEKPTGQPTTRAKDAAVQVGSALLFYDLGVLGPRRQPVPELVEVARKINLEFCNRLSVYSNRSLVGLHMFEGFPDFPLGDVERLCLAHGLLPSPVGPWPRLNNAAPSVQRHYRAFIPVGSEEARSIALVLASFRRSNWACSFPAPSFHAQLLPMLYRREVFRLLKTYRTEGPTGLIWKRRGPNRRKPEPLRTALLVIIREWYWDFGPTFVAKGTSGF
jgi:hypothetical protein